MSKEQVFIAKGNAPWINSSWKWKDNIANKFVSERVVCKDILNMAFMFYGCHDLISLDLSNFDTSNVFAMYGMFNFCENLNALDLSNFDTTNVYDMSYMFGNCENLTTLDLSSFDTSNVTSIHNMFDSCSNLTSVDISNFDTSNVTKMWKMFYGCSNLTTIKGIIDMKSCEDYEDMFYNCPKLRGVKIKNPPAGFESVSGLSKSQYTVIY